MRVQISTRCSFEAAHRLPYLPDTHKCSRLHGHNYIVTATVSAEASQNVMGPDFAVLDAILGELVVKPLDHRYLNDIEGLENPTAEAIAIWISTRLALTVFDWETVTVNETPQYAVTVNVGEVRQR